MCRLRLKSSQIVLSLGINSISCNVVRESSSNTAAVTEGVLWGSVAEVAWWAFRNSMIMSQLELFLGSILTMLPSHAAGGKTKHAGAAQKQCCSSCYNTGNRTSEACTASCCMQEGLWYLLRDQALIFIDSFQGKRSLFRYIVSTRWYTSGYIHRLLRLACIYGWYNRSDKVWLRWFRRTSKSLAATLWCGSRNCSKQTK